MFVKKTSVLTAKSETMTNYANFADYSSDVCHYSDINAEGLENNLIDDSKSSYFQEICITGRAYMVYRTSVGKCPVFACTLRYIYSSRRMYLLFSLVGTLQGEGDNLIGIAYSINVLI